MTSAPSEKPYTGKGPRGRAVNRIVVDHHIGRSNDIANCGIRLNSSLVCGISVRQINDVVTDGNVIAIDPDGRVGAGGVLKVISLDQDVMPQIGVAAAPAEGRLYSSVGISLDQVV